MVKKTIEMNVSNSKWVSRLGLILVIFVLLSGCYFPSARTPDSKIYENIEELKTRPVDIRFKIELPDPPTESERITLEILDNVTGSTYNSQRYDLDPLSEQIYSTVLSVPWGSIIKYRYIKLNETLIPEITTSGNPIAYRLLYASDNEVVTDILQAWQGDIYEGGSGILRGTLTDGETDAAIPDILVCAGGQQTFSDANGKYHIDGLAEGVHNVVFYAMDGHYRTFQQGAKIQSGMTTPADVKMTPMQKVNVTFTVTPPNDALGAPIYMAGSILQLGNTFADPNGSLRVQPKRMPMLTPNTDGTQSITLQLYAETDLRYKFTLGDGYWNAEQYTSGGFRVRQLIVPTNDVTVNQTIETWRSVGVEPITFSISIPPSTSPFDEKFIQFQANEWTPPIPLWPLGGGNYLYILYSPLETSQPIKYQFCRNNDCQRARDSGSESFERQVQPSDKPQTITLTLDSWLNWYPFEENATRIEAYIPIKPAQFRATVELTPEMNPSWVTNALSGISDLSEIGANTIIFSPQWTISPNSPYLQPHLSVTPLNQELITLLDSTSSQGFTVGLFPQIGPFHTIESWWGSGRRTEVWWNAFFDSYSEFILSYAKTAQNSSAEFLILGGKALLPAFKNGQFPDGSESDVPIQFNDTWLTLIDEIREIYQGDLVWATNAHFEIDPLPDFIYDFDGIYICVDSPLALGENPSFEDIQSGFTDIIDSQIYEVYRSTYQPIMIALAYPAVEIAASGCAMLGESCYNDGLFFYTEVAPFVVNFEEQSLIYNAIMPILASRAWITDIAIRGYDPVVVIHDGTSSINGKPAMDVIRYWFTNMRP
jgi:hypothetical protein